MKKQSNKAQLFCVDVFQIRYGPYFGVRSEGSCRVAQKFQAPKKGLRIYRNPLFFMARPLGLEPRTYGLEVRCSIQLS